MAYMSQEKKAKIAAELKAIVPKSWKYTLSVHHHSTICFNLASSPVDFLGALDKGAAEHYEQRGQPIPEHTCTKLGYCDLNPYHWRDYLRYLGSKELHILGRIFDALNDGNHDRSDLQSDYFDVGWYVNFHIGKWDKHYVCTAAASDPKLFDESLRA